MPNSLIIFDLKGAFAMFRKFYTNSSSLSYPFPPRSTLAGLIAGLMGYERDSYMADLSLKQCKIAISVKTPVRRVMQTVNYLMTKSASDFDGSAGGTQIPVEWIFPELGQTQLHYRVYVTHEDQNWLNKLDDLLKRDNWIYPPYLGVTECLAQVKYVANLSDWVFDKPDDMVPFETVVPSLALDGAPKLITDSQLIKERIPLSLDKDRKLESICDVIYERTGKGITAKVNREAFLCFYPENNQKVTKFGMFLE